MKTKIILTILAAMITTQVHAQMMTATQGLEKIKSNLGTAQKNKGEYDKNLDFVRINVSEVQKTKETTLTQKKSVSNELAKNSEALKKVTNQERDISAYITKENDKIALETKQIEQLQAMIAQVKKNQEQRELIINDYKSQLNAAGLNKKAWIDREAQLRAQDDQTTQAFRSISSEESNWVTKKKKYEVEAKRWTAESEKQQKIHDTYQGLSEGK